MVVMFFIEWQCRLTSIDKLRGSMDKSLVAIVVRFTIKCDLLFTAKCLIIIVIQSVSYLQSIINIIDFVIFV